MQNAKLKKNKRQKLENFIFFFFIFLENFFFLNESAQYFYGFDLFFSQLFVPLTFLWLVLFASAILISI